MRSDDALLGNMRFSMNIGRCTLFFFALWTLCVQATPAGAHNGAVALVYPVEGIVVDGDLSEWPDHLPE